MQIDFNGGDEIRFERIGMAGVVTLTRPKALNALTQGMVRALSAALAAWAADPDVALVVILGEGRAFCAGGDLMQVYRTRGTGRPPVDFFAEEYRLNAQIATFPKPYVALIDGIVMGGGVGISFHGSHRVMTENARFAMPEVGIGFFPDVGGSFLLSRPKGSYGMYLALTASRVAWGDALWAGLATHAVNAADLDALLAALCRDGQPDQALKAVCQSPPRETDDAAVHSIATHFGHESLSDVIATLQQIAPHDAFAKAALESMLQRSPTSLHVAFKEIAAAAMLELDQCLRMEFRIVNRMLAGHDFYEGIRAAVVDKGSKPQWRPAALDEVSDDAIDAYFAPLPQGELSL